MIKTRCLIIDDEQPAIELLEKYASMIDQLEVIGTSHSAVKAFDMLKEFEVDLIFLDIRMPVLNGVDFVRTLKNPPSVILTTAYRKYALDGFELDVIDYLLKPIAFDRFLKAVDKYHARINTSDKERSGSSSDSDHIFFNLNKTNHKVLLKDILYVESLKDYVRIHTSEENIVVKGNIGTLMKQLPQDRFIRIHRSFAIAISHIKSYNQRAVDINGTKLPIGVSYRNEIANRFDNSN